MDNILAMTEGSITSEIIRFDQIDHVFQELLQKVHSGTFMTNI